MPPLGMGDLGDIDVAVGIDGQAVRAHVIAGRDPRKEATDPVQKFPSLYKIWCSLLHYGDGDGGLPPKKWSSLRYGFWPFGGRSDAEKGAWT